METHRGRYTRGRRAHVSDRTGVQYIAADRHAMSQVVADAGERAEIGRPPTLRARARGARRGQRRRTPAPVDEACAADRHRRDGTAVQDGAHGRRSSAPSHRAIDHRRDGVADQVGDRARLGHEAIDAEQQRRARRPESCGTPTSVAASVMKPPPVTAAAPFEVSSSTPRMRQLLPERQVDVARLRDEDRRHRHVDRRAVEVERVAGRDRPARRPACGSRGVRAWPSSAAAPTPTTRCRARSGSPRAM